MDDSSSGPRRTRHPPLPNRPANPRRRTRTAEDPPLRLPDDPSLPVLSREFTKCALDGYGSDTVSRPFPTRGARVMASLRASALAFGRTFAVQGRCMDRAWTDGWTAVAASEEARSWKERGRRNETRPKRRKALATMLLVAATCAWKGERAVAANDAVLDALRARDRTAVRASQVDVGRRVDGCIASVQRVRQLIQLDDVRLAREELRKDKLSHLRSDVKDATVALARSRPTFERFEAMEVTGALEALDASLRRGAKQDALSEVDMLLLQLQEISNELAMAEW